jgi:RNA-binding protein Musashi
MPKLFVGNISFDATETQLRTHFEQIANVSKATIVMDRETGKPRGFGFVEFETEKGAQDL